MRGVSEETRRGAGSYVVRSHITETKPSHIWRTAVPVVPPEQPESVDPNVGLLAALATCLALWVLIGLTVYWLI